VIHQAWTDRLEVVLGHEVAVPSPVGMFVERRLEAALDGAAELTDHRVDAGGRRIPPTGATVALTPADTRAGPFSAGAGTGGVARH
jgi:hypothetical protein